MQLIKYTPSMKPQWDGFVRTSKNGTFLFHRDYMDYHADRFTDCSYIFLNEDNKITALFPASLHGKEVRSHGGLTYGGFILSDRSSAAGPDSPLSMLPQLIDELKRRGISHLIYKAIPHIYHRQPAEEDLYALFRFNARLKIRNLASAINLSDPIKSSRLGKRAIKRQNAAGITVHATESAGDFWQIIVDDRRVRHNVTPVHTEAEIQLLRDRFPNDILFFTAKQCDEILAGAVIYIANGVIHLQYAAASDKGKELYAVDVIYHHLLFDLFTDTHKYRYFDFGISNEDEGRFLNEGMIRHKEEFGARSIAYDIYELDIR